jgi:hypothetical protein
MSITSHLDPEPRNERNTAQEKDVSERLLDLIDILFGLVIVEGALYYRSILAAHGHRNLPVVIALALIMYTAVRSFVDLHSLMEYAPYQIMTEEPRSCQWLCEPVKLRTLELWRLYTDFLIVAAYSVMLLRAHALLDDQAAGLRFLMWSFPALVVLYLFWGELFRQSAGRQQFKVSLLVWTLVGSIVIAIAYNLTWDLKLLAGHGTLRNVIFLALEAALMCGYRSRNWRQQLTIATARPRLPAPDA